MRFGFGGLRPKQGLSMTNRRQNPSQTRVNPQNRFSISKVGRKQEVVVSDGDPDYKNSDWNFSLYPNPARNEVNVVLPNDEPVDVALYDLLGRRVRGWKQINGPQIHLPMECFAEGAYYLRVSSDGHERVKPLIIH